MSPAQPQAREPGQAFPPGRAIVERVGLDDDGRHTALLVFPNGAPELPWSVVWKQTPVALVVAAETDEARAISQHQHRHPEKRDFEVKTIARFEPDADNIWRFWFTDGTSFAVQAEASDGLPYMEICEECVGEPLADAVARIPQPLTIAEFHFLGRIIASPKNLPDETDTQRIAREACAKRHLAVYVYGSGWNITKAGERAWRTYPGAPL